MPRDELIPDEARIYAWIEEVFSQGIRRPGYPADRWAEQFCLEQFRAAELENVRAEPVELPYWEPREASLTVEPESGAARRFACFPLPHAATADGLEAQLVAYDWQAPEGVRDAIALCDVRLGRLPYAALAGRATWGFDPDGSFAGRAQVLPFGRGAQAVMEPAMEAGAIGFVGALKDYPSDSHRY